MLLFRETSSDGRQQVNRSGGQVGQGGENDAAPAQGKFGIPAEQRVQVPGPDVGPACSGSGQERDRPRRIPRGGRVSGADQEVTGAVSVQGSGG